MPIASPSRLWWREPIGRQEQIWLTIVVALGLALFIMMPVWHALGAQNSPTETYRVAPDQFWQRVTAFNAGDGTLSMQTQEGVRPLGDDVYLGAVRFAWMPNQIVLETGRRYRFHLSSRDVNHGYSIHKQGDPSKKANFQVVPGYEYVVSMTFDEPGVYNIICQEYCGIGHHVMVSKLIVQGGR